MLNSCTLYILSLFLNLSFSVALFFCVVHMSQAEVVMYTHTHTLTPNHNNCLCCRFIDFWWPGCALTPSDQHCSPVLPLFYMCFLCHWYIDSNFHHYNHHYHQHYCYHLKCRPFLGEQFLTIDKFHFLNWIPLLCCYFLCLFTGNCTNADALAFNFSFFVLFLPRW